MHTTTDYAHLYLIKMINKENIYKLVNAEIINFNVTPKSKLSKYEKKSYYKNDTQYINEHKITDIEKEYFSTNFKIKK